MPQSSSEASAVVPTPTGPQLVLDYTTEAILQFSPEGQLLWASPSLERMLGYHPSDVVGTPFDLNADTEAQSLGAAFKRMVSDRQEAARFLLQVRHADGTRRWVEVHAALVLDGRQQPTSAVASVRDITAQIEAERELHDEQDRRLAALDSMLDPHVLLEAVRDEDGRVVDFVFTDANAAACDYNRLPREELLGSTVLGLLPGHARKGGLLERYISVIETGEPLLLDDYVYSDELLDDERHFDIRAVKVGDSVSFTWRDVTGRAAQTRRLADSEQWQRQLLSSMAEGVVVHSSEGRIVSSNDAAQRMLGLGPEQLAGRDPHRPPSRPDDPRWDVIRRDGTPFAAADQPAMRTLATGRAVRDVVMGLRRPDGRRLWLLVNSSPLPAHPDGTGGGAITTFSDITTQIEAEQALATSRREYRLLAENAADLVFRSSVAGILEWMSPAVVHVLGWQPEDLIGNSIDGLLWHPDDAEEVHRQFAVLRSGGSVRFEARLTTKSGDHRWLAITARPVRDAEGVIVSLVGGGRDVTAEVEARLALAASEERYRLLAENSSDVVVHVREGVWVWVSPSVSTELGGRREDWVGQHVADLIHPGDAEQTQAAAEQIAAGQTVVGRARIKVADGTYHWFEARGKAFVGADGQPDGQVAALRLVDEAVAAEAELERRARYDDLTGVLKRGAALERLEELAAAGPTTAGAAVMFVDIDNFKIINDQHGHAAGDTVLCAIADRIRAAIAPDDLIARMGGDEFLVVLPGVNGLTAAVEVAEEVLRSAHLAIALPGRGEGAPAPDTPTEIVVTLSMGVTISRPGEDPDELIARADNAMYEAKRRGRNRVVAVTAREQAAPPEESG